MIKCEKDKKRPSMNVTEDGEKHSVNRGNVHVCDIGISDIHGKELLRQLAFHQEHKRSHNESNDRHICEIGVWTRWDLWSEDNCLGKFFMEALVCDWWWTSHQSSVHKAYIFHFFKKKSSLLFLIVFFFVYVFTDSVLCLGKIHENSQSNSAWEQRLEWFKEYIVTQKFGQSFIISIFDDISWSSRDNKLECESNARLISLYAK